MKKIINYFISIVFAVSTIGCSDLRFGDAFLEKAPGVDVTIDTIFSSKLYADRALVGNFADFFKWGIARQIPIEVIEYGNPDNSELGDLKGHNQVYLRGEAYIGWGILVPEAFARIKVGTSA